MILYTEEHIKNTPRTQFTLFSTHSVQHAHTFWEFTLVLDGFCYNRINNFPTDLLKKGEMYFIKPGDCHLLHLKDKNYRHVDFYYSTQKVQELCHLLGDDFYQWLTEQPHSRKFIVDANIQNLIMEKAALLNITDPQSQEYLNQLHTIVLVQLLEIILSQEKRLSTAPKWLSDLYIATSSIGNFELTIEELCRNTGYSHGYICKQFKKYYGVSLLSCINRSKVSYSVSLLGKEKIIDIALKLGWENPKNYTIQFKKVFGMAPLEYIKTYLHPLSRAFYDSASEPKKEEE